MPLRLLILALLLYMAYTWLRTSLSRVVQSAGRPRPGAAADPEAGRAALCPFCGLRLPAATEPRCARCGTLFREGQYRA